MFALLLVTRQKTTKMSTISTRLNSIFFVLVVIVVDQVVVFWVFYVFKACAVFSDYSVFYDSFSLCEV